MAHGARLTADGELFHESARRFDAQHFDLKRIAGDLRARHVDLLRAGITGASSENPAVPVLSDLVRRRPGMRLRRVMGKSDALDSAVEQGGLDLALVPAYAGQTLRSAPRDRRLPDTVPGVGSDIKVDPVNGPLITGTVGAKRVEMA
ncbi:hypothetical protein [Pseudacidovorax intermedius]|uniref:hypothetical protein n=1 Tax=Pseudacidovorax intermedius TaxID=433924 RepID=UPI0026EBCD96|nr:hypothetical protein [Pseudacidovorax intermedius]